MRLRFWLRVLNLSARLGWLGLWEYAARRVQECDEWGEEMGR